jgi:chromosome segregation ATPase
MTPETIAELERLLGHGYLGFTFKEQELIADNLPALLSAAKRVAELEAECDELQAKVRDIAMDAVVASGEAQTAWEETKGLREERDRLREALRYAADGLDDYNPVSGRIIETPAARIARAALETPHEP